MEFCGNKQRVLMVEMEVVLGEKKQFFLAFGSVG